MTIVAYKIGDVYTKSFNEANIEWNKTGIKPEKFFVTYGYINDIEDIKKITLEEIKAKYEAGEVEVL